MQIHPHYGVVSNPTLDSSRMTRTPGTMALISSLSLVLAFAFVVVLITKHKHESISYEATFRKAFGRHNSCAIVGSSGSLMRNTYGAIIDKHDMVIRANFPPLKGYEAHVGSKTNLMVVASMSAESMMEMCPPANMSLFMNNMKRIVACTRPNQVHAIDVRMDQVRRHIVRPLLPYKARMSGIWMVVAANYICDFVSVFGVSTTKTNLSATPYHYFSRTDVPWRREKLSLEALAVDKYMRRNQKFYLFE